MKDKKQKIDFAIGGQAVLEGVMMRSPNHYAVAVRKEDGRIKVRDAKYISVTRRYKILGIPVLRGLVHLFESMYIGIKCLNISSDEFVAGETDFVKKDRARWKDVLAIIGYTVYMIFVFAFAMFLFKFLPLKIADIASNQFPYLDDHTWAYNLLDGVVKTIFFLVYLIGITMFADIRRVFQYHGAEHKSVWAYENEKKLVPKEVCKMTRFHPRCGTSFILLVILISIALYTVAPAPEPFLQKFLVRLAYLPLIAGVSYEALKMSAKHMDSCIVRVIVKPGLWFQKITTKEPDDKQIEVACAALERCLELEK